MDITSAQVITLNAILRFHKEDIEEIDREIYDAANRGARSVEVDINSPNDARRLVYYYRMNGFTVHHENSFVISWETT